MHHLFPQRLEQCTGFALALIMILAGPAAFAEQGGSLRQFEVTATQFQFDPNRIVVNQGDRVRIVFRSTDVDHGFAVEDYDVDVEIPASGEPVTVEFVVDRAGVFAFACSEYCGRGHFEMTGTLLVQLPDGSIPEAEEVPGTGVEPDYTLINFPTTLRLPRHKMAFRLTHRFVRPVGQGDFGDLLESLFGLDGGAQIGLDFRFGLFDNTQIGIYRTSNRTIQLYGRQNILRQGTSPVGLEVALSVEGLDNFREEYSPSVALVLSRKIRERAVLYAVPSWVGNTNISEMEGDHDTLVLGLGGRLELTDSVAAVGEISPRLAGFDRRLRGGGPSDFHATFGVEFVYGGHVFQINVSNDIGTTPAQAARGQQGPDDWFLGFNLTRKF